MFILRCKRHVFLDIPGDLNVLLKMPADISNSSSEDEEDTQTTASTDLPKRIGKLNLLNDVRTFLPFVLNWLKTVRPTLVRLRGYA